MHVEAMPLEALRRSRLLAAVCAVGLASMVSTAGALAWTWPADGPVLRPFSVGPDPVCGRPAPRRRHRAQLGSVVLAPAGGTVSFVGFVPGGGRAVTIATDDGYAVTLLQLGATSVESGSTLTEGTAVGVVGESSDAVTAQPHVHFGVRVAADPNGYVDPLGLLPLRQPTARRRRSLHRYRWRLLRSRPRSAPPRRRTLSAQRLLRRRSPSPSPRARRGRIPLPLRAPGTRPLGRSPSSGRCGRSPGNPPRPAGGALEVGRGSEVGAHHCNACPGCSCESVTHSCRATRFTSDVRAHGFKPTGASSRATSAGSGKISAGLTRRLRSDRRRGGTTRRTVGRWRFTRRPACADDDRRNGAARARDVAWSPALPPHHGSREGRSYDGSP